MAQGSQEGLKRAEEHDHDGQHKCVCVCVVGGKDFSLSEMKYLTVTTSDNYSNKAIAATAIMDSM